MAKKKNPGAKRKVSPGKPGAKYTLAQLAAALETIAPLHLAEAWDNVGLLAGRPKATIRRVLLAIDLSPAVYQECLDRRADLLLVYHPPIFKPLKTLRVDSNEPPALAIALAARGVAIYAPHTALDTAAGGTNDVLAELLGAKVTGSFSNYPAKGSYLKLVTFVPEESVEPVADALFAAGAGHIGIKSKYTHCSFRTPGTGTFWGDASTHPAVGQKGRLERVPEIRLETILPAGLAGDVVGALRQSHPYEEPAFDLLKMETPLESVGLGRFARLPTELTLLDLARRAKRRVGVASVGILGNPKRKVSTLAVMAGSSGRMALDQAFRRQPFDCLITGELKHHDALAYHSAGIAALCLGHAESERPVLMMLQRTLERQFPGLRILRSAQETSLMNVL